MKQLFEYAIILQEKRDKDNEIVEEAEVLADPKTILAKDLNEVNIIAARAIPEEHTTHLDRVSIVVRPF